MDIEKYIASGILEAYALGDLSASEMLMVESMLEQYPAVREELRQIEAGLEKLAGATALPPSPDLKEFIFSDLAFDKEPKIKQDATVVPMSPRFWNYVAVASVMLMLFSSVMAYHYRLKWKQAEASFTHLQYSTQLMTNQYDRVNESFVTLQKDIRLMSNTDFSRVIMKAVNGEDDYNSSIYWNAQTQEAYLSIGKLEALSPQQQYQLWAIVDGTPVDMGVFDFDQKGLIRMISVANAATFAVTIEPRGGSRVPTLETMQIAGNV